ncbi:hypothetical protein B296_00034776 [Ensete ventricosum]|uniref:Uncharacterized protein n=1 Tax=Ensete ventricosum TaxID=4639 RepID=A0A427A489_ENSVE|nr:hypothetical protein B296_00034776 [Ensete ventricosum]
MGPTFMSMAIGGVDRGERVDREAAETSYPERLESHCVPCLVLDREGVPADVARGLPAFTHRTRPMRWQAPCGVG